MGYAGGQGGGRLSRSFFTTTPRPPLPWYLRWPGLALCASLWLAWRGSEGNFGALVSAQALDSLRGFARGFFPPAHSREFLEFLIRPLGETVAIAVLGLSGAVLLALPLSLLAASPELLAAPGDRPSRPRLLLWAFARTVLNVMRSIPELIWALLFVRAVGMGPAPGVLALAVGYAGVLGKVFAEIFESVPRGPAQALAAAGAGPVRAFVFGLLPGAAPMVISYALYRLDCALRASAVLGVVGAGGIGMQLELSLKMFAYDEVATLVIVLFALVAAVDAASTWIRRGLASNTSFLPQGKDGMWRRLGLFGGWVAALGVCTWFLDIPWSELFSASAVSQVSTFVSSMFPPEYSLPLLAELLPRVAETLAVSVLGTVLAAGAAILLAFAAAARPLGERRRGTAVREVLLRGTSWTSQSLLNLGRTLPEMLWALMFIFAFGMGPFAGALALAVHTGGVLGRLYAEALEEVPRAPQDILVQGGATRWGSTLFAVLPQAFPQLVAYTLYRWEVNVRASAVLGVVGAGGLGKDLHVALSLFDHHRVLTLVMLILILVTAVDFFSGWLRRQVMAPRAAAQPSVREAFNGVLEAEISGRRLLVLEVSLTQAQVFCRSGELHGVPGTRLPVMLDLGEGQLLRCEGEIRTRRDEEAGVFADLSLRGLGLFGMYRLYRFIGGRTWTASRVNQASIEAW